MKSQYTIQEIRIQSAAFVALLAAVTFLASRGYDRKAIAEGAGLSGSVPRDTLNRAIAGSRPLNEENLNKLVAFADSKKDEAEVKAEGTEPDKAGHELIRAQKHLAFVTSVEKVEGLKSAKNKYTRRQLALCLNVTPAFFTKLVANDAPVPAPKQVAMDELVTKIQQEVAAFPFVEKVAEPKKTSKKEVADPETVV